jgi:hypothetical protein
MNGLDLLEGLMQADFAETLAAVEGRADLIVTSPPYEDARTYGADVDWTFEDYQRLGDAVARALRPDGGQCLMVIDGPVRDYRGDGWTERSVMPWRVLLDWRERLDLLAPELLTFYRLGYPGSYRGRFRNDDEPLLWFAKTGKRCLNKYDVARKGNGGVRAGHAVSGRRADGSLYRQKAAGRAVEEDLKLPGTVWNYANTGAGHGGPTENEGHPARFPYALAADIVACFSNPGDLVVDPFVGSGTALVAALDGGRRFFGGDLLARGSDGMPWVDVARGIAEERYSQRDLFREQNSTEATA